MAKQKKENKFSKLPFETRLAASFALLEFCRIDAQNLNEEDITLLYKRVDKIKNIPFDDTQNEQTQEKALDLAVKYELDTIHSPEELKEMIQRTRAINAYKTLGYVGLCSGNEHNHQQNSQEVLASLLHELKFKDADELAGKIFNKELTGDESSYLFEETNKRTTILIDALRKDFKIYQDTGQKNPLIENFVSDLQEYTYNNKKKKLEIDFSSNDLFTKTNRNHFDKNVRPEFLKFYGNLMEAGKNSVYKYLSADRNYENFKQTLTQWYPDQNVIDTVLGLSEKDFKDNDADEVRKNAFVKKSEEIYCKTVVGLFNERMAYNLEHNENCQWETYIDNINKAYISGLLKGRNDLGSLALLDINETQTQSRSEEFALAKKLYKDAAEDQRVSVHHNVVTVASSYNVVSNFYPEASKKDKLELSKNLVSAPSGLVLVVGREKHQSMEPRNQITLEENPSHTIFAARVNISRTQAALSRLPQKIQDKIYEYVNLSSSAKTKEIDAKLLLPEPEILTERRKELARPQKESVNILDKHKRYERA